ncbi:hypothetical protein [Paenibacillus sp. IHBB 3054]|uniref:hypothetical protein n=1 Tax=Paenibacillus sp. IHBB 3054 TaxID=3425689 RepID=UPI003F6659B0
MNNMIKEYIDKYLVEKKNIQEYLNKCRSEGLIPNKVLEFIKKNGFDYTQVNVGEVWPATEWLLDFGDIKEDDFEISYKCRLMVSKLVPLYYLQHEYETKNLDKNAVSPILDGFDTQPYTRVQAEFEDIVNSIYNPLGYMRLSYGELSYVICGLEKNTDIFGSQVTIESIFFRDFLELC